MNETSVNNNETSVKVKNKVSVKDMFTCVSNAAENCRKRLCAAYRRHESGNCLALGGNVSYSLGIKRRGEDERQHNFEGRANINISLLTIALVILGVAVIMSLLSALDD